MPLTAPFCTTQNQKLSLNRIGEGFGTLNNYNPNKKIVGVGTETGEAYDVAVVESHISLIRRFPQGQAARINKILATFWKVQTAAASSGAQTSVYFKIIARIIGLRNPPANLERIVFDPLWDKNYPSYTAAGLTGTEWETASAWPAGGTGRLFNWQGADLFFDAFCISEGVPYNFDVNINVAEQEDCAIILCPVYIDRAFYDTSTGLARDMFNYAGGNATGGTDYRTHMVKRTLNVYGERC